MSDKYFPIQTDTACQLKWAWSTVFLQTGTTASCHRVEHHQFNIDTFNFHNTEQKLSQRKNMLDGNWPVGKELEFSTTCESYCGKIEKTGIGTSDRQFFNTIPNLVPTELELNPDEINVTPTILEIYIDNTCNLSCVYCVPELSSRIDFEMKKYGEFSKNGLTLKSSYSKHSNYADIQNNFWSWMVKNASGLKRLHLLGGEPFYQKQFDDFLNFFNENPCPNLEFNIVTNLMLSGEKLKGYIERIKNLIIDKKISRLDITASIDCWGPQQEFVRFGLDLTQWEENFRYLIDQRWIKLNINNTISILTVKTLPDLLDKLSQWAENRKIEHYFTQVYYPSYMTLDILGKEEFQKDFSKILSMMETKSWRGTEAKKQMEGIISTNVSAKFNQTETLKLLTFLDEMDRRRNTNWRELFPWLIKYEDLCGIQK